MPMKKVGSENVVRDPVTMRLSNELPRLRETTIPSSVPMTMESTVEVPSNSNVLNNRPEETISSLTGRLSLYEYPNWKVSKFRTYVTNLVQGSPVSPYKAIC